MARLIRRPAEKRAIDARRTLHFDGFVRFGGLAHAQNANDASKANQSAKRQVDPATMNFDFTTSRFGSDEAQIWKLPDPTNSGLVLRHWGEDSRAPGLTISRPLN